MKDIVINMAKIILPNAAKHSSKWGKTLLGKWCTGYRLSHDNVLAHFVLSVWEFLARNYMTGVPLPSVLEGLAPCEFVSKI